MPGEPSRGFADAAYAQTAQMVGAGPMQTTLFTVPSNNVALYDEMIVPEVPEGGRVSDWKLKPAYAQGGNAPVTAPEPAQAVSAALPKDRESAKVIERMEVNRRRKEQIQQKINETSNGGTLEYGANTRLEQMLETARKKAGETQPPAGKAGGAEPVQQTERFGTTQTMTEQQRAYANQTAAYQPPALDRTFESAPEANVQREQPQDRFGAYRRPNIDSPTQFSRGDQRPEAPTPKKPEAATTAQDRQKAKKPYPYPMIELLNLRTQTLPDTRDIDRANAMKLEQTLESFGIPASVQRVTHGPAVTRFELGLVSSGINVKRIMNIADNIALDMAANGGVRIEVPIPGTNLFGVEVPNKEIVSVSLAEVLTSPEMTNAKSPLSVALGKDIAGRPIICDLAKMPHLLIAGQTGSGKSVCINSIINSLLYRATPEEVRMIMIDPKVVELQGYNKVPHLLIPVVSDPHKASGALAWAVQEMLDRYHKMQSKGVREIASYNAKVTGDEPKLPRIVIIIDELSDLMLACKKEVEESIIRLAQLARAAGIHVVVATQRPTVNVITGLIKANIPSRIAFAVASSIDSRTILDMNGAEKLLGKGDMFYYPTGEKAPLRVQGCYLSDAEISNIVDYIGNNSETDYDDTITEIMESPDTEDADNAGDTGADGDTDERLQEAVEMVLSDGQASISMLQRRMKIGYARAGRLIDEMASRGIVSKSAGSKPREILMSYEQYLQQKDTLLR
ncbi:MAG TPA: DNA translocase FtsK, partial [Candidatus Limiplasma sp.]|nr:DNA translocase FtsK [Candidatus Limiplasma sp.]